MGIFPYLFHCAPDPYFLTEVKFALTRRPMPVLSDSSWSAYERAAPCSLVIRRIFAPSFGRMAAGTFQTRFCAANRSPRLESVREASLELVGTHCAKQAQRSSTPLARTAGEAGSVRPRVRTRGVWCRLRRGREGAQVPPHPAAGHRGAA